MARKNNIFTQVPVRHQKRNHFDLSHEVKMSCKFANLYPILLKDTLPGDTFSDTSQVMARLAPMLAPIYHRLDITVHFFFVPNRLLANDWEAFITGGQDGTEAPVLPYITPAGVQANGALGPEFMRKGSLWDYFGLPVLGASDTASSTERLSVLPFLAYGKVWSDYYRDPNFNDELKPLEDFSAGDVSALPELNDYMSLYQRGWEKDYFTSALDAPQRGLEVLMPLAGTADVTYMPTSRIYEDDGTEVKTTTASIGTYNTGSPVTQSNELYVGGQPGLGKGRLENIDEVTISNSTTSINDFRRALAIQTWLENNARAGYRYTEQILSHFDVRVPDYRLQRAEYLGGGKQPITIREVVASANSTNGEDTQPLGDLAGHGLSVGNTNRFNYYCQEHGWIIGILSVMPRTAYSQGIDRMWSRQDKFDYAWPELAHIGEQEILNKEIFFVPTLAADPANAGTFGYIPRYSEYKFSNDRIAGDFRDSLGFWHLGRNFLSRPALSASFTTMEEDGDGLEETYRRIFYVQDGTDYVWLQIYHSLHTKRPLPYFGVPKIQ